MFGNDEGLKALVMQDALYRRKRDRAIKQGFVVAAHSVVDGDYAKVGV